jgi:hypothetical protein
MLRDSRKIGSGISSLTSSAHLHHRVVHSSLRLRFPSSSTSSFTSPRRSLLLFTPQRGGRSRIAIAPRRGFASNSNKEQTGAKDAEPVESGGSRRRVEVNLNESVDQVAMGYLKKYGRKLVVDWPLQGLKYGALGALAVGTHTPPHCTQHGTRNTCVQPAHAHAHATHVCLCDS